VCRRSCKEKGDFITAGRKGGTNCGVMRVAPTRTIYWGCEVEMTISVTIDPTRSSYGSKSGLTSIAAIVTTICLVIVGNAELDKNMEAAVAGAEKREQLGYDITSPSV